MSEQPRNVVRLETAGTVVQARTVKGGVHLHPHAGRVTDIPRQLPLAPHWLVARDQELNSLTAALDKGLAERRLAVMTVEGVGGVGKTALVLFWAQRNLARFPDGQLFVDLRGFDVSGVPASASAVLSGFLVSLGVEPAAIPADQDAAAALYRSLLSDKQMLVILDNALDGAHVLPLLPGDSSCAVVVTSRRHLAGLRMRGASRIRLDSLPSADAQAFLARRIGDFVDAEPAAVDTLLRCCAGLPLALAIVAARTSDHPEFPLAVLASELEEESVGLSAFDAGDGTSDLRAVLSWSSAALDDDEARTFRMLGAAGLPEIGCEAAASLMARPATTATQVLRALEAKYLVRQHTPGRFRMHELVRRHAAELSSSADTTHARSAALRRLGDFYLHTARAADELLYPHRTPVPAPDLAAGCGPVSPVDDTAALEWFVREHQQILAVQRTAMRWGWSEHVWQLSRALDTYHYRRSLLRENVDSSRLGASAADLMGDETVRALAHRQLGRAYTRSGQLADAEASLWLALTLTRRAGDTVGEAHTLHDLARTCSLSGRTEQALIHSTSAMTLYRAAGNSVGEAHALNAQGRQHAVLGSHERARRCCQSALSLHEASGNTSGQLATLETLGFIARETERHAEALDYYSRGLALCHRLRNQFVEAKLVEHVAGARIAQDMLPEALGALRRAYDLYAGQRRVVEAERVRLKTSSIERALRDAGP
ncbi:MAG: tetratricopeptide repeat protein [Actinophytocola sp.]|uniref:tetratricopeptide repeat protein n=1 Tax=Actinophytocola sp. TaxID=1872138 RepID=UPI00132837D0|nr:tetratricopeptide repeat protein [Actinophytocola sp.]MPZ83920.1 tetratricopeptide repeat protein [Actinophytocola sp.]